MFAHDCGVRLAREITNRWRVPVVTARQTSGSVHSLLDHCPLARRTDHEGVEIQLKSIDNRVVVSVCSQSTRANQGAAGEARHIRVCGEFVRGCPRMFTSSAAYVYSQF